MMIKARSNRLTEWVLGPGRAIFVSVDFAFGVGAWIATFMAAESRPSAIDSYRGEVVAASLAIGLTVLATTVALMTNFVSLLGGRYRFVIRRARGGMEAALWPYKVVVALSVVLIALAGLLLLAWELQSPLHISAERARAIGVATTAGVAAWSVVGVAQLVLLNLFHALQKNRMEEVIDELQRPTDADGHSAGKDITPGA